MVGAKFWFFFLLVNCSKVTYFVGWWKKTKQKQFSFYVVCFSFVVTAYRYSTLLKANCFHTNSSFLFSGQCFRRFSACVGTRRGRGTFVSWPKEPWGSLKELLPIKTVKLKYRIRINIDFQFLAVILYFLELATKQTK